MSRERKRKAWKSGESERRYTENRIQRSTAENQPCLREFADWLSKVRGLKLSTISVRIHCAGLFVDTVTRKYGGSCAEAFRDSTAIEIEDFFIAYGEHHGPAARRNMQASMRLFLRFAVDRGWVDEALACSVPSLVSWRSSSLPRSLSEETVSRLLSRPFQHGQCPSRDWAVVCLLATYGVRRAQVSALRLDDLDWQGRSVEFAAHKGGKAVRHALTPAVAEALADYLRNERPRGEQPWVFLRHRRPHERLSPGGITSLVRARGCRRGLGPIGPHTLRHTFARRLLRGGQSMKTIADLLGHRSLTSTGIYAKVDTSRLLEVAEEWPEVES